MQPRCFHIQQVFHRAPSSRRPSSVGSTIAELLNETFDSEDSELKKLDWDEWEEDIHYDITEDDFPGRLSSKFNIDEILRSASDDGSRNRS